jgi:hypothetical protein
MLKRNRVADEFEDAFDATGQLKPGVTRIKVPMRMMDAASVPTKVVAEPGFITRDSKSAKGINDAYTAYDLAIATSYRRASDALNKPCANCGTPNDDDANFCDACGEEFPDNGNDAADPTLAKPPTGVANKVSAADHGTRMEILYQQRDAELANAYRRPVQ